MSTLDSVLLTPAAVEAWHQAARTAAQLLPAGIDIPDEDAEVLRSGELRVHVTHPDLGCLIELVIPATDWAWRE